MNIVLHIKKKWRKPAGLMAAEEEEAEDAEEEDPDVASLNFLRFVVVPLTAFWARMDDIVPHRVFLSLNIRMYSGVIT